MDVYRITLLRLRSYYRGEKGDRTRTVPYRFEGVAQSYTEILKCNRESSVETVGTTLHEKTN